MTATNFQAALDGADRVSIMPDMSLLNNNRRDAVPMPSEVFGPAWDIIGQVADETSTAPDYAAAAYLTIAASLIGAKRWASPYGGDWEVPAILWFGALGDPSSRKTAPLSKMAKPLKRMQQAANEECKALQADWEAEAERAKVERVKWKEDVKAQAGTGADTLALPTLAVEPDAPPVRRYKITDCTPEAAAYVLKDNPQGVLAYNDELAGWLQSFDRYNGGGRPFYLQAFEGDSYSVTRKGDGSFDLPSLSISVLGSIQPEPLARLMEDANDGLVPRFLWVWPEKRLPSRPVGGIDYSRLQCAYERLELLQWGKDQDGNLAPRVLNFSEAAATIFEKWEFANASNEEESASLFATFKGKMSGAVVRLALVSELTQWAFGDGAEPSHVSSASVAAAIKWVEEYAKPMAERVFGDAAVSQRERNASMLARYIRAQRLGTINARELKRSPHKSQLKPLQKPNALEEALEDLEVAGWIIPKPSRQGGAAGQPRKDYTVVKAVFAS